MVPIDLVLLGLLSAALVTSIIELGLSAYLCSVGFYAYTGVYDPYDDLYSSELFHVSAPGQFAYLVFDSIWSLLVTGALILIAFVLPPRFNPNSKVLGIVTLVLTLITMLHWLAGFAALAAFFAGFHLYKTLAALLAFAILSWLIYLALTVLTFLTAAGVLKSERRGRGRLFGHDSHHQGQPGQTYAQQQPGQGYSQPMQPMQQQPAQPYMQQPHEQTGYYQPGETIQHLNK